MTKMSNIRVVNFNIKKMWWGGGGGVKSGVPDRPPCIFMMHNPIICFNAKIWIFFIPDARLTLNVAVHNSKFHVFLV